MNLQKIYGRRAVLEALRSGGSRVRKLILAKGGHGSILQELRDEAQARGLPIEWLERHRFDKLAGDGVHQGVMAILQDRRYTDLESLVASSRRHPARALIVLADEIEDPRNLGAIARCAEGAGADGLVITTRRSADITPAAEKASGGAVEHLPIARVTNLAAGLQTLKTAGLWVAGLDAAQGQPVWEADLKRPLAVVVGAEGKGLRRLTRELCDLHLRVPLLGKVNSLNAAVATGIVLFEIVRQRRQSSGTVF